MLIHVTVRCLGKVADTFKPGDLSTVRSFRCHSAQPFEKRTYRFLPEQDALSIWTLAGQQRIAYAYGAHHRGLVRTAKGQVNLMFVRGKLLLATARALGDVLACPLQDGMLGVDLGITNLAVDSTGCASFGAEVERIRLGHHAF